MSLRRAARKAFNGSASTTVPSEGLSNSDAPAVPALEAFGHHSDTSFGAQEDDEEGPSDAA